LLSICLRAHAGKGFEPERFALPPTRAVRILHFAVPEF
jgi:hypothetical protein